MIPAELIEAAARILSPNCMWDEGYVNAHQERRRERARVKAREIASLILETCAKLADGHKSKVVVNEPLWHDGQDWTANSIGEAIRALLSDDQEPI
jgi:hypothetical protein